jgi:alkanesulfonate monooxygenase SsuD/methylene tetrahydromethanopterin reductase-like flavin-dependent oxidoreductase (luciferase family)
MNEAEQRLDSLCIKIIESDSLVDNLVISGNEDIVASRLTELLTAGLDELLVNLVPIKDGIDEMRRLMLLIGQL